MAHTEGVHGLSLCAYCYIALQQPLLYVKQTNVLVASTGNHTITTNWVTKPVQGKRQKYATEGSIKGTEDTKVNPWGLFQWAGYMSSFNNCAHKVHQHKMH